MIEIKTIFTEEDVVAFLKRNGLDVRRLEEIETVGQVETKRHVWKVKNWYTQEWERAEDVFRKLTDMRQQEIYLEHINKMELINLFKR